MPSDSGNKRIIENHNKADILTSKFSQVCLASPQLQLDDELMTDPVNKPFHTSRELLGKAPGHLNKGPTCLPRNTVHIRSPLHDSTIKKRKHVQGPSENPLTAGDDYGSANGKDPKDSSICKPNPNGTVGAVAAERLKM